MRMREFGRTGLKVSSIGFGAAPVGGHYGDVDDVGHIAAVRHAIDRGINIIDTSPYYSGTRSETLLGQALADGYRTKVILCTKACRYGRDEFDFSAKAMLTGLDDSLRRLRTEYVDVWHAHDIEFATDYEQVFTETADALHRAKAAGKCRFVGMTGYPPELLARAVARCRLDAVLNYCHYSLCNDRMLSQLVPVAAANGVAACNASALMMGLFASKGPPAWHPAPERLKDACARVVALCRARGVAPEELALRYALADERIATTFVGMSSIAEVDTNLRALDDSPDPELLVEVRTILEPVFNAEWPSGNWRGERLAEHPK